MLTSNIFSSIHQNEVTRIMPGKDHLKTSIVEEKDEKEGGAIYNPFDEEDDKEISQPKMDEEKSERVNRIITTHLDEIYELLPESDKAKLNKNYNTKLNIDLPKDGYKNLNELKENDINYSDNAVLYKYHLSL